MKAEDARKMTEQALVGPAIERLLVVAYMRIQAAAKEGKREVSLPFYGCGYVPSPDYEKAALRHLENEGYTVHREIAKDVVSW